MKVRANTFTAIRFDNRQIDLKENLKKDMLMWNNKIKIFKRCIILFLVLLTGLTIQKTSAQDASNPYLGEIMLVAFDIVPHGWHECDGSLLPINQNQALFSLLGTTYGGNGQTTFALPDLRGRVPMNSYSTIQLGQRGGEESHTLTISELPVHTHLINADSTAGTSMTPIGNYPARDANTQAHYASTANNTMKPNTVNAIGGSQPHENRMPHLTIHYIIALQGIFPSRN